MSFAKGDEFWFCPVGTYRDINQHPTPKRGVITGGGEVMVRYRLDGHGREHSESRHWFEIGARRTREEAIEKAVGELDQLRKQAFRTIDVATDAIAWLIEQRSEEAGAPEPIVSDPEKLCPRCGHPMMQGPLRVRRTPDAEERVTADWWCANCHHAIEPESEPAGEATS
jgi:hypothetical protein